MRHEDLRDADCGIAQTLGVVSDWWSWLILREIAGSVQRFDALQSALGISRRALSERLIRMVADELIDRSPYSQRPPRYEYELTARGQALLPVLIAMQEFGDQWLLGDGEPSATAKAGSPQMERVHSWVGRKMPRVDLTAQDGKTVRLGKGGWHALYCFPGAFVPEAQGYPPGWSNVPGAPGCTLESRTYAEHAQVFSELGVELHGVSTQRPDQLAAFASMMHLPFLLLSDQDGHLATALRLPMFRIAGVDRLKRVSLLIDPDGIVRYVQAPITDPAASVTEMLNAARSACTG